VQSLQAGRVASDASHVSQTHERVVFRVIVMPCCQHILCWVNPRLPTYCPECGKCVVTRVRAAVTFRDDKATLHHHI
jgi:hypothetical protein